MQRVLKIYCDEVHSGWGRRFSDFRNLPNSFPKVYWNPPSPTPVHFFADIKCSSPMVKSINRDFIIPILWYIFSCGEGDNSSRQMLDKCSFFLQFGRNFVFTCCMIRLRLTNFVIDILARQLCRLHLIKEECIFFNRSKRRCHSGGNSINPDALSATVSFH